MNQNALLALCLILSSVFVVYSVHFDYPLAFHSEEYDHLILAKETVQGEKIAIGFNWELGFSVFFAVLNTLLLNNLNSMLVFIPIVFALIISFSSFLLGRYLFKSRLAGIFFGIFSLMIPSNPGVMGLMFAVPNSMALSLAPMLVYLFLKGTASKKTAFIFMFLLAFNTIIHPAFTLLLIPVITVYLLLNPKLFEKNQLKIAVGIILLIILFPLFASRIGLEEVSLSHDTITSISKNISKVLVWESITHYSPKFFLVDFLGNYILILACLGFGAIIMLRLLIEFQRKKGKQSAMEKDFTVSKHQIILPIALAVFGLLYIHFNLKDYTFIAPYERTFLELMLVLLLSAASGAFLLWKTISKIKQDTVKPLSAALILLILFLFLTVPFSQESQLYKNIEPAGISSLEWIKEFTPKKSSFIALPDNSLVIRAFTERKIFASPPTRAGIPDDFQLESFFIKSCQQKDITINATKADYLFTEKEIECNSIEKIYDKKSYKIYKTLEP
ncbi:MAG: hypothetical protein ABH986_03510 [archaeon]